MSTKKTIVMRFWAVILICLTCLSNINITASAAVTCDVPFTQNITYRSVPAEGSYLDTQELYLYPGDIVYFDFTHTNSNVVIKYGLVTPSNTFRCYSTGAGSTAARGFITINEEGIHKFKVKNTSLSYAVTIDGHYYTGSSYPFRNSKVAKTISQKYSRTHYGLDIVETTSGTVEGYPVYSIQKGYVKVSGFSTTAGNYVVIIGDNGYTSRYLHLRDDPIVKEKSTVTYQTLLGYAGNSGKSSGAHLHIDVNTVKGDSGESSPNGTITYDTTIDPESLFPHISFTYK